MSRWSEKLLQCSLSLSPFLLHTLVWKKQKGYASDRLKPNRRGIQMGYQVDLDWTRNFQRPESWSVTTTVRSLSIFCLDDIEFKFKKRDKFEVWPISIIVLGERASRLTAQCLLRGGQIPKHTSLMWIGMVCLLFMAVVECKYPPKMKKTAQSVTGTHFFRLLELGWVERANGRG